MTQQCHGDGHQAAPGATARTSVSVRVVVIAAIALCLLAIAVYVLQRRTDAPDVAFTTLDGSRTSLRELRGKVVYVNFWATSCATCIKEMPEVINTYRRFASGNFDLVAVAMAYDPPDYVRNYVQRDKLPFKVVLDQGGSIAAAFDNVNLTPTAVLIDKDGRILRRIVGEPDFPVLQALIDKEMQR